MEIAQAATFLAGSILVCLGIVVIGLALVVLNNIFHKYWKPLHIWQFHVYSNDIHTPVEPTLDNKEKK